MKYFLLLIVLTTPFSMEAYRSKRRLWTHSIESVDPEDSREQETLAARRIHCLWKDREFTLARQQIYEFFDRFPASEQRDPFQILLGNIALYEKDYAQAITAFDAIRDSRKRDEMRIKRWQALYHLEKYETLYQEIQPILHLLKGKEKYETYFLFAEATFREALILSHYTEGAGKAKQLAEEALPYYESLVNQKKFASHAKLATAEIHRLLDHPREAALLYLELAKLEKENEALLFHAAAMLAKFDEEQATQIFRQVTYLGGTRSSEACYQWMQLQAKQQDFFPLFAERAVFLTKLPSVRLPLFHFYTGMVLYQDKKWQEAALPLVKSLDMGLLYPYDKNALFALIVCGHELGDASLVERAYTPIKERYHEEGGDVALLRALTYKKIGELDTAYDLFEELIAARHSPSVVERSLREKAQILVERELWDSAYSCCRDYLKQYSSHDMVKLAVDLALGHLDSEESFVLLVEHIEKGFNEKLFSEEEKPYYKTLMAKGLIKLERYKEALALLETQSESAERESLLTLCCLKEGLRPEKIIEHGERALQLDSQLPEKERLHLYLFNAYLDAAKESNDISLNQSAEEHLYSIIHSYPVSLENRLWLAHRFAKNEEKKERAIAIFEELLYSPNQVIRFPREAFVLSTLYTEREEHEKAGLLLERLAAIEECSAFGEEIRLAAAHHQRAIGNDCKALELYGRLRESEEAAVAAAAKLEYCRMLYSLLPKECGYEEMESLLSDLKNLWIKKRIITEPIHLEAAIDYINYQAPFLDSSDLLKLVNEIYDHFTLEEDIWSKDYHMARYQMPSRDLIYQAYMRYIEAMEAELEGERKTARALFSTLCQGKYAVSKYLVDSASRRLR